MSFTDSEVALLSSNSSSTGKTSANASVSQSRQSCVNSFLTWARIRFIDFFVRSPTVREGMFHKVVLPDGRTSDTLFLGALTFLPQFLDHRDKDILQRVGHFVRARDLDLFARQPCSNVLDGRSRIFVRDDMQPFAKQRHAPAFHFALQQVVRPLRRIGREFDYVTFLLGLQV